MTKSYPVITYEGGEVGGLQIVCHVEELGTVDGVNGGETTAGKQTCLQHSCDGCVLGSFCE